MANPKQKSQELPGYLTRIIPLFQTPQWLEADRWRQVVKNQPVAAISEGQLINDLVGTKWEVRARNPKEEDELAEDILAYTRVLNPTFAGGLSGFDIWAPLMGEDLLRLPIGGNSEIIRWPDGMGPFSRPHPKGHVYRIVYIDGATLYPTYDKRFPIVQKLRQAPTQPIFFEQNEIMRLVSRPRTEIERWGYGMPAPEKIYLSILLLYRGDTYYSNLLLDTPEAGLLDLADMSQESATEWAQNFRELLTGIDPMKIGILYEHEKKAEFINFGRPPTELMFADTYLKYAQICTAGYGLTVTDIGLGEAQKTLAGSIRDERRSRRSGYGVTREKFRVGINSEILPPYLEFVWIESDEESLVQRGRGFLLNAQAIRNAVEIGLIDQREGQAQLIKDGFITVEVKPIEPPEETLALPVPARNGKTGKQEARDELEKVPASEGGRGDITGKAELGENVSAAPPDSSNFDKLAIIFRQAFDNVIQQMTPPRLMKLIKATTREMFPIVEQAIVQLSENELLFWQAERLKVHFGEPSEFDELPEIQKANDVLFQNLDDILDGEDWWQLDPEIAAAIALILKLSFEEGAIGGAQAIQELLYTEGLRDSPSIIGLSFDLKNPRTLAEIETKAAQLIKRVNDGTKFFIKRILVSGVDEGLSSPAIAQMIKDGANVEQILREAGYTSRVIDTVNAEIEKMSINRIKSIVNTEIARAETDGRLGQWKTMGLTKKRWVHTGGDVPCEYCQRNIDQGLVDMDFMYDSVFGGGTVPGPPAHPNVDHCHVEFDEAELIDKAGELNIWTGE